MSNNLDTRKIISGRRIINLEVKLHIAFMISINVLVGDSLSQFNLEMLLKIRA